MLVPRLAILFLSCLMSWLIVPPWAECAEGEAERVRFFEEQVHPILAKRCYTCHGPEKQESGLRLDAREAILKGGDSETPAAVAGDAAKSLLMQAVRHEEGYAMPPETKLPDAEIAVLEQWVRDGLVWSTQAPQVELKTPEAFAEQARREHWSLQPVTTPPLPAVSRPAWLETPVDGFVLANLDSVGLTPSSEADRRTLIRRLSFDLWGLPPAEADVEAFLNDSAPDAYARLVDRWLASPRYGERWGRHWLDLARYADTKGYAFANDRRYPYAYTYRDYVIDAFNADKPYSEFVLEQLAADQLPIGEDKSRLAAMGFLTTGRKFNNRHDDLDDQIDVVSRGLLGLTVSCARCHDHKYDPVPIEDYYSLYGVFASSQEPAELPLIAEPQAGQAYAEFEQELKKRQEQLEVFKAQKHAELLKHAREGVAAYLVRVAEDKPDSFLDKLPFLAGNKVEVRRRLLERWKGYLRNQAKPDHPVFGPWQELVQLADADFAAQAPTILAKWQEVPEGTSAKQINPLVKTRLREEPPGSKAEVAHRYAQVLIIALQKWALAGGNDEAFGKLDPAERQLAEVIAGKNSPTDISQGDLAGYLNRADRNEQRELEKKIQAFEASSPAAPPRAMVLKEDDNPHNPRVFLRGNSGRPGKPVPRQFLLVMAGPERQPFQQRSGRLELAQKIVDAANPLTRRVIANRIWMYHFGQSLVRTPSDFGVRCEQPLQAALLEFLAAKLLDSDWSLKQLHREILLSSTYRQASVYRADAAAKDPENRRYWRMNRRRLEFEPLRDSLLAAAGKLDLVMGGRSVDLLKTPYAARRTVYGYIDRQDLPNLLRVFDFASPDQSQAERPRTTVPQQALFLMNSPFVIEQAKSLLARPAIQAAAGPEEKVNRLYGVLFQRPPTSEERESVLEFVQSAGEKEADNGLPPWEQLAQLLLLTNEFTYID